MIQKDDLEQTPKSWCPEPETLTNGRNNEKAINAPALYNAIKAEWKVIQKHAISLEDNTLFLPTIFTSKHLLFQRQTWKKVLDFDSFYLPVHF